MKTYTKENGKLKVSETIIQEQLFTLEDLLSQKENIERMIAIRTQPFQEQLDDINAKIEKMKELKIITNDEIMINKTAT